MTKHPVKVALERIEKFRLTGGQSTECQKWAREALPLVRELVKDSEDLEWVIKNMRVHYHYPHGDNVTFGEWLKDCPPHLRERLEKMK